MGKVRYGFTDLVVDMGTKVPKYVDIYDNNGNCIGEIECYYIENED